MGMTGRQIRTMRERLGLTQAQLAHLLGVSHSCANRWEMGHTKPRGINVQTLSVLELAALVPGISDKVQVWSVRGPLFTLYRLLGEVYERPDWFEETLKLRGELIDEQLRSR